MIIRIYRTINQVHHKVVLVLLLNKSRHQSHKMYIQPHVSRKVSSQLHWRRMTEMVKGLLFNRWVPWVAREAVLGWPKRYQRKMVEVKTRNQNQANDQVKEKAKSRPISYKNPHAPAVRMLMKRTMAAYTTVMTLS